MNKLQEVILSIAKEIKEICEKNNINYYMDGGTLLGAVRHKGFIPWDDDMDFLMKREDYNRFLKVCEKELDKDKFFIQNEDTEEMYAFAFTKIQLNGTEIIEDFSKDVPIHHGIFVDIFPYDNLPDNAFQRKKIFLENKILKNMIWVKCGYGKQIIKKNKKFLIFKVLGIPFSLKRLKKMRYRLITKFNNKDTERIFNSDYPKCNKPNNLFKDTKLYDFEDTKFFAVNDAHSFLTEQYGNYMEMPPKDKQVKHSHYEPNYGPYK